MIDRDEGGGSEPTDPRAVVAGAIQNLTAARLGRAFIPLALLFAMGAVGFAGSGRTGLWTAIGALGTSAVMLAYGLRTVQRSLGRSRRTWMSLAMLASVVPPGYGLWVLGWRGLRALTDSTDPSGLVMAILYVALGVWVLRTWMGIVEIERLARVMSSNLDGDGDSA